MKLEKRSVDLNAYIIDLSYEIKNMGEKEEVTFSFRNLNYGSITAIKLTGTAQDSFGDTVKFGEKDSFEIKKASLNVRPGEKSSFTVEFDSYDIKKMDITIGQIVYMDGKIVTPKPEELVTYEIEKLSSIWGADNHFEKDALDVMREIDKEAVCFPKMHERGWICACGNLNSEKNESCALCGHDKERLFEELNEETVKIKIEERERKKQKEIETARENERIESEKKRKRQKNIMLAIGGVLIAIIVSIVIYNVNYNVKYGLAEEDKAAYEIAQENYEKIDVFTMGLGNEYMGLSREKYYIEDFDNKKDRTSAAEKDSDYLYSRSIYKASSLLYKKIEEGYPEKYQEIYRQLSKLHQGDILNNVSETEILYIKNSTYDREAKIGEKIDEEIKKLEEYMKNQKLNLNKVTMESVELPPLDYSNVYGINLGILYYEDGTIKYIGEFADGKANGFGRSWYTSEEGSSSYWEGTFEDGKFVSGECHTYDTDGNEIDMYEMDMEYAGEFDAVQGLTNRTSSEQAAQEAAETEDRNKQKAIAAVEKYISNLLNKQPSIKKITWTKIPTISGGDYYFSCDVIYSNLTRKGKFYVVKQSDGTFKVETLMMED